MMYDELIEQLRETSIDFGESDHVSVMLIEAADAIEGLSHAVDQMTEWRKNRWIPVTERLPYESVFVHGKGGELVVAQYSHKHKWWEDDEGYYCDTNYVTHWMPLPEPPKEEK